MNLNTIKNDTTDYTEDGLPIIKPIVPQWPKRGQDGAIAQCGVCGLRIMPVMGYCCPRTNCPCGFGSVTCSTTA